VKVSIITICYNRQATIAKAIDSVLAQDYSNIQYLVIDGNSSDGTAAVVNSYGNKISTFICEPDKGMYDALNKGLRLATGDIVGLMHSDDEFYDATVVSQIVAAFKNNPETDGLYGDGIYVSNDAEERLIRNRIGGAYTIEKVKSGWLPLHPTVYFKKSIIDAHGVYDLNFKIASDTEWLLRYLYKHRVNMTYMNSYIVKMRMGGLSTSYKRAFEVLVEDYNIYKYHGLAAALVVFQKKCLALRQYLAHQKKHIASN
jgi:glycosyltransferase involved in cell wall biosynthesis